MKQIPLTQGKFALVDDEDYDWLMQWKWHVKQTRSGFSAVRNAPRNHGKRQKVFMHRVIMDCPENLQIDHIHHITLDNRKSELRICTNQENSRNRLPYVNCSSRFKGVYWHKKQYKWKVRIIVDDHHEYIGCFNDEVVAAKAYDKKAVEVFGEFAQPNFIEGITP